MKYILTILIISFSISGCVSESAIPLGNNMMQIDVSAAPIYGRAGAQRLAMTKAARATIQAGYDKFIVINNAAWNETTVSGGSQGSFTANRYYAQGSYSSGWGTQRRPEAKVIIKMFHYGDKGAAKAADAHKLIKSSSKSR